MNRLVSAGCRIASPRAWWLGIAVLCAAMGCRTPAPDETARPADPGRSQTVDLSPLLEFPLDLSSGLLRAFPDYEPLVIGGIQQSNRKLRTDGVVELVRETYDTELDEANRWVVDVSLTQFDTPARAARELNSTCYSQAHGGASSTVRWREGVYCISSVLHLRNDSRSLHLPTNTFFSWVIVRRDTLVVRMYERHQGSSRSAKNQILQEIAGRLSPPSGQ